MSNISVSELIQQGLNVAEKHPDAHLFKDQFIAIKRKIGAIKHLEAKSAASIKSKKAITPVVVVEADKANADEVVAEAAEAIAPVVVDEADKANGAEAVAEKDKVEKPSTVKKKAAPKKSASPKKA